MTIRSNEKSRKKGQGNWETFDWNSAGKVPPQDKEIEEAVLGAAMLSKEALLEALDILKPGHFYVKSHETIFEAFVALEKKSYEIDIYTVADYLRINNKFNEEFQPYTLTSLTKSVTGTAHLHVHCAIVLQKYFQREVIRISNAAMTEAFNGTMDVIDLVDKLDGEISGITQNHLKGTFKPIVNLAMEAISRVDFLRANKGVMSGVPSGFKPLDAITNGWQATDLIILAARPSVGKTAFALNLAKNAVTNTLKITPTGFFSLEMGAGQLVNRLISEDSHISLQKITNGRFDNEEEYKRFTKSADAISRLPLYIDDTAALSIIEFKSRARRLVRDHKVGLIIIDYLQLMSGKTDGDVRMREQEISNISRNLKALAKELNIPIIALSQLSRAIESRTGGEPQLSDLRESGAIEQDADLVAFLGRMDYQKKDGDVDPSIKNDATMWIKKHRNGALEKLAFKTVLSIQKWFDLEGYDSYKQLSPEGRWSSVNSLFGPAIDDEPDLPF